MRLHFAVELILELVVRRLGVEKVGAHISEFKTRIDFNFEYNISIIFDEILEEYNEIIKANKPIETGFSDLKNQRRFWQIESFAKVPCGGTHVRTTEEVGSVCLKRSPLGKSKERIEIKLLKD